MSFTQLSTRLHEDIVPNLKNVSYRVDVHFAFAAGDDGVLVAQGGRFGGWSIYVADGNATWVYNYMGVERTYLTTPEAIQPGDHLLLIRFEYDGGGLGRGGRSTLLVDGVPHASVRLSRTVPFQFSLDETFNVGQDWGTPVTEQYVRAGAFRYSGTITSVHVQIEDDWSVPHITICCAPNWPANEFAVSTNDDRRARQGRPARILGSGRPFRLGQFLVFTTVIEDGGRVITPSVSRSTCWAGGWLRLGRPWLSTPGVGSHSYCAPEY